MAYVQSANRITLQMKKGGGEQCLFTSHCSGILLFVGYRHIHLLSNKGESLGYASLFVHIEINSKNKSPKSHRPSFEVRARY